jgi:hypothetical protein
MPSGLWLSDCDALDGSPDAVSLAGSAATVSTEPILGLRFRVCDAPGSPKVVMEKVKVELDAF